MQQFSYSAIIYSEFKRRTTDAGCRTLSKDYRPCNDEEAHTFECTVGELLEADTYPVYFIDSNGCSLVQWNDSDARPIRFDEFVRNENFMTTLLRDWFNEEKGPIAEASVITLHCGSCDRRIVIDGVHRLAWLGAKAKYEAKVEVIELSGRKWPAKTPDFNVVCKCIRE